MEVHEILNLIINKRLDLIGNIIVEQFWFSSDDIVVATLGSKDVVCAPILYYKIIGNGALQILDDSGSIYYEWTSIELKSNILEVDCNGTRKKFSISDA